MESATTNILSPTAHAKPRPGLLGHLLVTLRQEGAETHQHSRRVGERAARLAIFLGAPSRRVEQVRLAGLLHDVGKVRTPRAILEKPGPLTEAEYAIVRRHVEIGAAMVAPLGDPELTAIVRHHHERFDGRGYPSGLAGEQIPFGARLLAVVDTFDAVTSSRPYRPAMAEDDGLDLLDEEAGTQLDPDVVAAFRRCYECQRATRQAVLSRRGPAIAVPIRLAPG